MGCRPAGTRYPCECGSACGSDDSSLRAVAFRIRQSRRKVKECCREDSARKADDHATGNRGYRCLSLVLKIGTHDWTTPVCRRWIRPSGSRLNLMEPHE